ncbi:hypothetical protein Tco_1499879 [Tanacetum coccineum]
MKLTVQFTCRSPRALTRNLSTSPPQGVMQGDDDEDDDDDDVEEDEDEDEEEAEEEHPASANSIPPPVHHILSPPLPVSPLPLPVSPTYHLGYRAAMIRLRAESPFTSHPLPLPSPIVLPHTRASVAMMRVAAPSTYILAPRSGILPSETPPSGTLQLLPIPLPTPSPPLLLPSIARRAGVSEVTLPPRKRLCIALGPRFEGTPAATDVARLSQRMTNFVTTVRQDTNDIYGRLDDTDGDSRDAWVQSMDASDTARSKVRALWTTVLAQQTEIAAFRAADRARQAQLVETLRLMSTLQTQVTALQGQQ